MNILAIGAHPDDIEISCGGTLAKYAKQGHKVFTATTTNGNIGSATLPMDEIAKIRKEGFMLRRRDADSVHRHRCPPQVDRQYLLWHGKKNRGCDNSR